MKIEKEKELFIEEDIYDWSSPNNKGGIKRNDKISR